MKLSLVTEADTTRRDFLQKIGAATASSLVSGGLDVESAKEVASAAIKSDKIYANIFATTSWDYITFSLRECWEKFIERYTLARRVFDDGSVNFAHFGGDGMDFSGYIDHKNLPKLIRMLGKIDYQDENGISFQNGEYIHIGDYDDQAYTMIPVDRNNLMQEWWENWEKDGGAYMDETFAKFLKSKGINPLRNNIEGGAGLNHDYVREAEIGTEQPEPWESEYVKEPEKIIPRPDDYLASPMHQPFESKIDKALGL
jgi:hypothetical protein